MLLAGRRKRIKRGNCVLGKIQHPNHLRGLWRSWVVTEKVTLLGVRVDALAFSLLRSDWLLLLRIDWLLFLAPLRDLEVLLLLRGGEAHWVVMQHD